MFLSFFIFLIGGVTIIYGQTTTIITTLPNPCGGTLHTTEVKDENNFTIYPNPTKGIINIQFDKASISENLNIKVFDTVGNLVFVRDKAEIRNNNIVLHLESLISGIYFIVIQKKDSISTKKLIINK